MKSKIKQEIDKNIYRKFDNIVFVSNDNKEVFNKLYIMKNNQDMLKKEKVIYNYIDKERIFEKSKEQCELNKRFLNNKIIYMPEVLFINNGKIIDHDNTNTLNDENDLTTRLYNKMLAINNVEEAAIQ